LPAYIDNIIFHNHDLERTCFPGMYWLLPYVNVPALKAVSSQSAIKRRSDYIGLDRDSCHLGILSTILQHFTLTMKVHSKTQWPTAARNITLHCRMYPTCKVVISQYLAIPGLPQSGHTVGKSSADAGSLYCEAWQTFWPQVILKYQPPIIRLDYRSTQTDPASTMVPVCRWGTHKIKSYQDCFY
jgi:hypothetical protein